MTISMLGRYQIVSQLGRGAMATVYRALDPAIERTVAIKTLNPDLPDENMAEVKERFLREAKSAGRLLPIWSRLTSRVSTSCWCSTAWRGCCPPRGW